MKYRFVYDQPLKPGVISFATPRSQVVYHQTKVVELNAGSDLVARERVIEEIKGKQFWWGKKFYPVKIVSLDALRPIPLTHLKIDESELI